MTRALLFTAALIVAAPTAWAQTQISTPGSNGGNAVGSAFTSSAPSTGGASAPTGAAQISTPGSNGGNAVGSAVTAPVSSQVGHSQ